eukprot:1495637-Lingulodinium_polyedra.AAC.1
MRSSSGSPASPGRAAPAPGAPAFAAEGCVPARPCPGPARPRKRKWGVCSVPGPAQPAGRGAIPR